MTSIPREWCFWAARRGLVPPNFFLPWLPLELERQPGTVSRRETTRLRVRRGARLFFEVSQAPPKKVGSGPINLKTRHVTLPRNVHFTLPVCPRGPQAKRGGLWRAHCVRRRARPAAVRRISAARRKTKRCRSASERVEGCGSSEDQRRKPVKGARALGRAPQCFPARPQ